MFLRIDFQFGLAFTKYYYPLGLGYCYLRSSLYFHSVLLDYEPSISSDLRRLLQVFSNFAFLR